ncbi:MAG: cob(I)yrinic acid a,c-diamide adenosyltransferase [Thermodesulfobacteriota bacterium]
MKKKIKFKGLIQIYTGSGKGKTTAALGLALRAAGHKLRVLMVQFMKGGLIYGELKSAKKLAPYLQIIPAGRESFVNIKNPDPVDMELAKNGWQLAKEAIISRKYQLIILDEINVAVKYGLIPLKELLQIMKKKPKDVELILTGRWANSQAIKLADLVTEMKEIKHYYKKGIDSRLGIER